MAKTCPSGGKGRPHWRRWVAAALISWIAAPVFAPLPWRMMMVEGAGPEAFAAAFMWTYVIGVPLAGLGVLVLLAAAFLGFAVVARWPWWLWALAGGGAGLAILGITVLRGGEAVTLDAPTLWFLSCGLVPGAAAAIIFRAILLRER